MEKVELVGLAFLLLCIVSGLNNFLGLSVLLQALLFNSIQRQTQKVSFPILSERPNFLVLTGH